MVETMNQEQVLELLRQVEDPEIPVLNVVEMGLIQNIEIEGGTVRVDITPTYSGCPAIHYMCQEISRVLKAAGVAQVSVNQVYTPVWTTDRMTASARQKLRDYGIAPPGRVKRFCSPLDQEPEKAVCPQCGSANTDLKSPFSSTSCKSLFFCNVCMEPFEKFKAI